MEQNLKDILSHLATDIDQETLLLYLQGKLAPEKQHELEKQIMDNEFAADAIEGLQNFTDKKKLALALEQLQSDLKKKTSRKKALRKKRQVTSEPWLMITLTILLLLIIISYYIIFKMR